MCVCVQGGGGFRTNQSISYPLLLSVDPTNDDRIAGHSESQVVIWDRRNFEKPIITINTMQQVFLKAARIIGKIIINSTYLVLGELAPSLPLAAMRSRLFRLVVTPRSLLPCSAHIRSATCRSCLWIGIISKYFFYFGMESMDF